MRFAMFKGEKSVTDLAARLFRLQGKGSQAATRQAGEVLLQANPQLKDPSKVAVGSLIAIPDTAPPVAPGEEARSAVFVQSQAAQNAQAALDSLQQRLSDIEASMLDQLKAATDRFQAAEVKTAIKSATRVDVVFPGGTPSFDTIAKDAKDMLKETQTAQQARKQSLTQLRASLASFFPK